MSRVKIISPVSSYTFIPEYLTAADTSHFWVRWRFQWALNILKQIHVPLDQPGTAVDVGCGFGVVKRQFEQVTSWQIDGFDVDYQAINKADDIATAGQFYYYDILEMKPEFKEKYDYLFLFDVLEHISEPVEFLRACRFHLKKGGLILINVPAMPWLYSSYDEANGHVKRYRKKDLTEEMEKARFSPAACTYWGFFMIPFAFARKMIPSHKKTKGEIIATGFQVRNQFTNKILNGICHLEEKICPNPVGGTSLLMAGRKEE